MLVKEFERMQKVMSAGGPKSKVVESEPKSQTQCVTFFRWRGEEDAKNDRSQGSCTSSVEAMTSERANEPKCNAAWNSAWELIEDAANDT